jgi:geranylgeranyl diphosphate synthase, type I
MPWAEATHVSVIEERMRRLCLGARDHELGRVVWEHVAAGGKRLRARLALAAVRALGGAEAHGVAWGAACELLHNASLIHDDIQDGDERRRGQPSLWARYGVPQAINAGDLAIALSYLAIEAVPGPDTLRWRLARLIAGSSRLVVLGQASEMTLLAAGAPAWQEYEKCVTGKTSALFALPVEGAALIAGRSPSEAAALADACRPMGLLFQIQDDILDLYGDSGREARGSDLAQAGKVTALVVEHLRLHPEDRGWLLAILAAPRERTAREAIDEAIARFADGGALAAVWRRIDDIQRRLRASREIAAEPALAELVSGFVTEALRPVEHTRPGPR